MASDALRIAERRGAFCTRDCSVEPARPRARNRRIGILGLGSHVRPPRAHIIRYGAPCAYNSGRVGNDKSALVGEDDSLHAVAEIEFHEDARHMGFDSALLHDEARRDLRVRQPLGNQA